MIQQTSPATSKASNVDDEKIFQDGGEQMLMNDVEDKGNAMLDNIFVA